MISPIKVLLSNSGLPVDTFRIAQSCGKVHGKVRAFQVSVLLLYLPYYQRRVTPMQKIEFGSTGLVIEKNGFGCLPIQRISETEAVKLLHKAS